MVLRHLRKSKWKAAFKGLKGIEKSQGAVTENEGKFCYFGGIGKSEGLNFIYNVKTNSWSGASSVTDKITH